MVQRLMLLVLPLLLPPRLTLLLPPPLLPPRLMLLLPPPLLPPRLMLLLFRKTLFAFLGLVAMLVASTAHDHALFMMCHG
ncbi:hypothetical protein JKP88DRAFT_287666 [Tribonema minus]|uniref:Uncharacterized protein n=1 Tax=Tribonema minus TaxID=303371 RepID=A0A835Z6N8_9STRA|nr:hypothetical protein JKP88DRAFT_287666 [Tribonema minus]